MRLAGFSLIELSICLIITALFSTLVIQMMEGATRTACIEQTPPKLDMIQHALEDFAAREGRFPRPGSAGAGLNDAEYGVEVSMPGDARIARVGTGSARVLIGALPHASLHIAPEQATDCWGNKFTYAVTQTYTDATLYADPNLPGAITVNRETLGAPQTVATSIGYIVVSHGANKLGANPAAHSGPARQCNAQASIVADRRIDKENCDTLNAVFFASDYNDGTNDAQFFDDFVAMGGNEPVPTDACAATTVNWGTYCSAPALITLAGLSVNLTNTASGYTGVALSTCANGVRTTLGVCLPVGACSTTNLRTGAPMTLFTGIGMSFGTGVCKKVACCNGTAVVSPLSPCLLPVDLPGLSISCP